MILSNIGFLCTYFLWCVTHSPILKPQLFAALLASILWLLGRREKAKQNIGAETIAATLQADMTPCDTWGWKQTGCMLMWQHVPDISLLLPTWEYNKEEDSVFFALWGPWCEWEELWNECTPCSYTHVGLNPFLQLCSLMPGRHTEKKI